MRLSQLTKPLTKSALGHKVLGWLIGSYIRFVFMTTRWTYIGREECKNFCQRNKTGVVLQWHNRIALVGFSWDVKNHPISVLVSGHTDGQFVGSTMANIGMNPIAGSSSKGGAKALLQCMRVMRDGQFLGMTPDGPRGPRMRMKDSPALIVQKTGAPISVLTYSVKRRKVLGSWDRFILPLPFNKGVFIWREVNAIGKDASTEELAAYSDYLENALTAVTNEADALMGHEPIEPAGKDELPKKKKA